MPLVPRDPTRPVESASNLQVRRPLYGSAIDAWRPNHAHLRPLVDGLGPHVARYLEDHPSANG